MYYGRLFFYAILLFYWVGTKAQSQNFVYFDLSEAVSNEVIKSVIKDEDGHMWFATDEGLLRYNGVSSQVFKKGLHSTYVKHYLNTQDGRLLVIDDLGIKEIKAVKDSVELVPFQWGEHVYDQPLSYPKSIFQDVNGNIWIGEISSILRISKDGAKRFNLGNNYQSISYHRTFTFQEDAFGTLWIAPYKGQLLRYDPATDQLIETELELPVTDVAGFAVLNGDYLMLGGKEGILQIKIDSDHQLLNSRFIEEVENISALQSVGERLFVGTWDQGLLVYQLKQNQFSKIEEANFNDVVDFYYDSSVPEVWVIGSENVGLISFSVIEPIVAIGQTRVESVSFTNGELYYSIGQEIRYCNLNTETPVARLLQTKSNYFNRILVDKGIIWIGDSFGAILKYNVRGGSINLLKDSTGNAIKHAFMDDRSNKWFAGNMAHLVKVQAYTDRVTTYPIASSNVIRQAPNGRLYCGGAGREKVFYEYVTAEDRFEAVNLSLNFEPLEELIIEDFDFANDGTVWVVSNEGLLHGDPESGDWQRVNLKELAANEQLKSIVIKDDIIWLAGSSGLYAYNGKDVILFNTKNGLPSKLLNWRGLHKIDKGILVSTAKGIVMIESENIQFEPTPQPVIQQVRVPGVQELEYRNDQLIVPYEGSLELEFTTLTYPGKEILYQSRIVQLTEDWSDATSNRQLSFIGFNEGEYTLEVRSREIGALWSEPVKLKFTVPVPWYKTWWAYVLFTVFTSLLVGVAIRVYNYNLILQKRRFKSIIEERTRLINEQKNEIIAHKNHIIEQKEELLAKSEAIHKSQQALSEADVNFLHLKEKQLLDQIDYKNKQITTHTLHIIQKNETLKGLKSKLEQYLKSPSKIPHQEIKKTLRLIDDSYRMDKDWEDFRLYFEQIYTGFYAKLKVNCPALTSQELRHCALIRLNLSVNECATILGISPDSVKVSRSRIRKKLDLDTGQNLTDFILSI